MKVTKPNFSSQDSRKLWDPVCCTTRTSSFPSKFQSRTSCRSRRAAADPAEYPIPPSTQFEHSLSCLPVAAHSLSLVTLSPACQPSLSLSAISSLLAPLSAAMSHPDSVIRYVRLCVLYNSNQSMNNWVEIRNTYS